MDAPANDPWLAAVVIGLIAASVTACVALAARWQQRGALLDYEPRAPVPWGAPAGLFAVVFLAAAFLAGGQEPDRPDGLLEIGQRLMSYIVLQSLVVAAAVLVVVMFYRPTQSDLGLPVYADQLLRDAGLGIIAYVAAAAPVYGVQQLMISLFGPSQHPMIEMVALTEPNLGILLLMAVAVVVVAPISEEILFRLLLQGWLEKWEDAQLGWRTALLSNKTPPSDVELVDNEAADDDAAGRPVGDLMPPRRGVAGLPYGWGPILISSLLFAAAHYGHGPDPIALFVFALVLGFLYQRTHRIIPCIVAHAAFNALAMLILWRAMMQNVE